MWVVCPFVKSAAIEWVTHFLLGGKRHKRNSYKLETLELHCYLPCILSVLGFLKIQQIYSNQDTDTQSDTMSSCTNASSTDMISSSSCSNRDNIWLKSFLLACLVGVFVRQSHVWVMKSASPSNASRANSDARRAENADVVSVALVRTTSWMITVVRGKSTCSRWHNFGGYLHIEWDAVPRLCFSKSQTVDSLGLGEARTKFS